MYGVFVKNMVDGLINEGVTISAQAIISKRPKGVLQYFVAYCVYFARGFLGLFKKFDLIYCHYALHNAPLALLIRVFSDKPLVVNIHGSDMLGRGWSVRLLEPFRSLLLKRATLIVVPSNFMKRRTMKLTGLPEEKFFVSPSGGIALPNMTNQTKTLNEEVMFGYVGRIVAGKGVFILLEALSALTLANPTLDWKLIVAGSGPDEGSLLKTAKEHGLENRIIWKGIVPQKELAPIFSQMTVLVFPTLLEESLGLVGLEAMAHGVPVIGSKIGGLQDYIIDQKNGLLYEAGDIEALTKILQTLCVNRDVINKMKDQALVTSQKYEAGNVSEQLYHKLCTLM